MVEARVWPNCAINVHSRSPATHSAEVRVQAKGAPVQVKDAHDNVIHF